jgi:hypothetical protein
MYFSKVGNIRLGGKGGSMKPNIFEIATKELTQDGFITWLLQWADPDNKKHDEKLNACAIGFVKFLIHKSLDEKYPSKHEFGDPLLV